MENYSFKSMTMNNNQYIIYEDAQHAWLQVSLTELVELDIVNVISRFSRIDQHYAFLETDRDMVVFLKAKFDLPDELDHMNEEQKQQMQSFWPGIQRSQSNISPIRKKQAYSPSMVPK